MRGYTRGCGSWLAFLPAAALALACSSTSTNEPGSGGGGATGGSSGSGATGGVAGTIAGGGGAGGTGGSGTGGEGGTSGSGSGGTGGAAGFGSGGTSTGGTGGGGTGGTSTGGMGGSLSPCGSGETCVPEPASFWAGPVALWSGATPTGACTGAYATPAAAAHGDLTAAAAQCSGCSCGAPACQAFANLDQACAGTCPQNIQLPANTCKTATACPIPGSVGFMTTAGNATCPASGPSKTIPSAKWSAEYLLCAGTPGAKCGTGKVCAPPTPAGFGAKTCIYRSGNYACPGSGTYVKLLAYQGFQDTRNCSACTCGNSAVSCGGTVQYWAAGDCSSVAAGGVAVPKSTCTATAQLSALSLKYTPSVSGTCTPSGGSPTGSATPDQPVTICCLP